MVQCLLEREPISSSKVSCFGSLQLSTSHLLLYFKYMYLSTYLWTTNFFVWATWTNGLWQYGNFHFFLFFKKKKIFLIYGRVEKLCSCHHASFKMGEMSLFHFSNLTDFYIEYRNYATKKGITSWKRRINILFKKKFIHLFGFV